MHLLNADLHCHSNVSDGTLTPEALATRAHANGVELWSLTDHDEIGGQQRARDAALALGMGYLTGTEISVSFAGETVHIVGLGFDAENAALREGLATTRSGRRERAQQMADGLAQAGIHGAFEGALALRRQPRADLAHPLRALPGRKRRLPRHPQRLPPLPHRRATRATCRTSGRGSAMRCTGSSTAGGIAVIAHPARYRFTPTEEYALFTEFIAHGGQGVEVMTGSHSAAEQIRYADTALEFGLLASRGSDFHSPAESRTELGTLPDLPGRLTPVWEALRPRIQRPLS